MQLDPARGGHLLIPLLLVACRPDGAVGSDEASESSGSTDSTGDVTADVGAETDTDGETGDEWPECESHGGFDPGMGFVSMDWPFVPEIVTLEQGTCSVDGLDESPGGSLLAMTCADGNGLDHAATLALADLEAADGRLEFLVGMTNLTFRFEVGSLWSDHSRYDTFVLRDSEGTLLFLGTSRNPWPGPDGFDGVDVGLPGNPVDAAAWTAPFLSFKLADGLCGEELDDPDQPLTDKIRRMAIDADTGTETVRVFDGNEHRGIVTSDGVYDLVVGRTRVILETNCGDCPWEWANFFVVRTGD